MLIWFLIVNLIFVVLFATFSYVSVFKITIIIKIMCKLDKNEEKVKLVGDKHTIYEIFITLICFVVIALFLPDFVIKLEYYFQHKQIEMFSNINEMGTIISLGIKVVIGYLSIRYSRIIAIFFVNNK